MAGDRGSLQKIATDSNRRAGLGPRKEVMAVDPATLAMVLLLLLILAIKA
jgi:hypothetical protein